MADTKISNLPATTTPVDTDVVPVVVDMTTTPVTKMVTWANIKATLKTYFDTLYTGTPLGVIIHALTGKTTPVDADELVISDSADSNNGKKLTWANIKATLKTYFDTLYYTANQSTYTPTLDNTTNVAASSANLCMYYRAGDVVTVAGSVQIDPTATGSVTLGMTLPIASNLTSSLDLAGVAMTAGVAGQALTIQGDATNDRANFVGITTDAVNRTYYFQFSYLVK